MFSLDRSTLTEYLIEHRRRNPEATGELKSANRRAELPAGNTAKN